MDEARLTAQAISEGLNCLHGLAMTVQGNASAAPDSASVEILDAMERAYQTTRAGNVVTDLVITDEHLVMLRRARTLVEEWIRTGRGSTELVTLKDAILDSLMKPHQGLREVDE